VIFKWKLSHGIYNFNKYIKTKVVLSNKNSCHIKNEVLTMEKPPRGVSDLEIDLF